MQAAFSTGRGGGALPAEPLLVRPPPPSSRELPVKRCAGPLPRPLTPLLRASGPRDRPARSGCGV